LPALKKKTVSCRPIFQVSEKRGGRGKKKARNGRIPAREKKKKHKPTEGAIGESAFLPLPKGKDYTKRERKGKKRLPLVLPEGGKQEGKNPGRVSGRG